MPRARSRFGGEQTHVPVAEVTISGTVAYGPAPGVAPYPVFYDAAATEPVVEMYLADAGGAFTVQVSSIETLSDGFPPEFEVLGEYVRLYDEFGKAIPSHEGAGAEGSGVTNADELEDGAEKVAMTVAERAVVTSLTPATLVPRVVIYPTTGAVPRPTADPSVTVLWVLRSRDNLPAELDTASGTGGAHPDDVVILPLKVVEGQEPPPVPGTAPTITLTATPGDNIVAVDWSITPGTDPLPTGITVGRDGVDQVGSGPWTSPVMPIGALVNGKYTGSIVFDKLFGGTVYTFTATLPGTTPTVTKAVTATPAGSTTEPDPDPGGGGTPTNPTGTWLSGASGESVRTGAFGTWRGTPVQIVGTWNDGAYSERGETLKTGNEYGGWSGPVDVAIGGIFKSGRGESWSGAAAGACDTRWRNDLNTLKANWGGRPQSNLYIRFAHEFNGHWYDWSILPTEVANAKAAWQRWANICKEVLPQAKRVLCANDDSTRGTDPRAVFPGNQYVDVISVDRYNQYPPADTLAECTANENRLQSNGAPRGLERYRQWAQSVGLPIAVSEWGNPGVPDGGDPGRGDNPAFIEWMHAWFKTYAGTGAGNVLYEIYFDVEGFNPDKRFVIYPTPSHNTKVAAKYRELF